MALERVIRPYQLRQNTIPIRLEVASTIDPQPIVLQFGRNGSGKVMTGSFSSSLSIYQTQAAVERSKGRAPFSGSGATRPSPFGSFTGPI